MTIKAYCKMVTGVLMLLNNKDRIELISGNLWSGRRILAWSWARVGDTLEFSLPVKKAGRYAVHLIAAQTPQSGVISVQLDSQPFGFGGADGNIDLIAYLIFKPFSSFCQALAGILMATECGRLVRIQRIAAVLPVFGSVAMLTGSIALSFSANGWFCLWALVSGFVLLATAGAVGHYVETKAKEQSP